MGAHRLLPALAVLVHGEWEHGELGTVSGRLGCIVAKYENWKGTLAMLTQVNASLA